MLLDKIDKCLYAAKISEEILSERDRMDELMVKLSGMDRKKRKELLSKLDSKGLKKLSEGGLL